MDKNIIRTNADKIIRLMKVGYAYTLTKLEEITTFSITELCMALLVLIRDNKVKQFQSNEGVRYILMWENALPRRNNKFNI